LSFRAGEKWRLFQVPGGGERGVSVGGGAKKESIRGEDQTRVGPVSDGETHKKENWGGNRGDRQGEHKTTVLPRNRAEREAQNGVDEENQKKKKMQGKAPQGKVVRVVSKHVLNRRLLLALSTLPILYHSSPAPQPCEESELVSHFSRSTRTLYICIVSIHSALRNGYLDAPIPGKGDFLFYDGNIHLKE